METPNFETKIDTVKAEHLIEGVNPILACVGDRDQYGSELSDFILNGKNVDYYSHKEYRDEKFIGTDREGYVISNIDKSNKYTEHLYNCTSVIAVGNGVGTGENISFLTHQDPYRTRQDYFQNDLINTLMKMKNKCSEGTVDIVIVGGRNIPEKIKQLDYEDTINTLNSIIENIFGFEPVVICGPKHGGGQNAYDDVYLDTKTRRLYVVRPKDIDVYNDSFMAGDLSSKNEGWKSGGDVNKF